MIFCLCLAALTFSGIALANVFFPVVKIKRVKISLYPLIALAGAGVMIAVGLAPFGEVANALTKQSEINPLKISALFFSMTFISVYLDATGFFKFLAAKAAKKAKGNGIKLFVFFYLITSLLTVFTSNDVVILTMTPFICFFCKHAKIDPVPFLAGEFAAANTWSMALIIGNPTNVYLSASAGIGFFEYFKTMAIPTLAAGATEFVLVFLIFGKKLKTALSGDDSEYKIADKRDMFVGLSVIGVCLAALVTSDITGLEMWLVASACAVALLVYALIAELFDKISRSELHQCFKSLPYELLPFLLSMFVFVVVFEKQGISTAISRLLGSDALIWKYGAASFICANLINNIPMSMLFGSITSALTGNAFKGAVFATVIGSNVGAFLTPMGALAGIMFTSLTSSCGVKYGFKEFIRYGVLISIPTLIAAIASLSAVLG